MALKPVVFVPGFPSSELLLADSRTVIYPPSLSDLLIPSKKALLVRRLVGPDDPPGSIVPGPPIRDLLGVAKQAQTLYDILSSKFGYDTSDLSDNFAGVGWDWRKGIDDPQTQQAITDAIGRLAQHNNQKVVVVVHSTGGVVFRALLDAQPQVAENVEQVLAFGVPWVGSLESLFAITQGNSIGFLFAKVSAEDGRAVTGHAQAAYDIFPPDPARTDMDGVNLFIDNGQQAGPMNDTRWIDPSADFDFMRQLAKNADQRFGQRSRNFDLLKTTNVAAWGAETWGFCGVDDQNKLAFNPAPGQLGDGTVPLVSASWLRGAQLRTMLMPIGAYPVANIPFPHAHIWSAPPVLQLFDEALNDTPAAPFVCAAADSDAFIDPNRDVLVRMSAQDAQGNPLPNCIATIQIPGNPVQMPFNGQPRGGFLLKRQGIQPNIPPDLFRFEVKFDWTGGSITRVLLIHT